MKLVGAHDVVDRVPIARRIIDRERGEEPGDLDDEVGTLVQEELRCPRWIRSIATR